MNKFRITVIVSCSLLGACAGVGMVRTSNLNTPPKAMTPRTPESVTAFMSAAPSKPYTEVMLFQVSFSDAEDMVAKIKNEAAKRGCDGVIFSEIKRMEPKKSAIKKPEQRKPDSFGEAAVTGATDGALSGLFPTDDKETSATCIVFNE